MAVSAAISVVALLLTGSLLLAECVTLVGLLGSLFLAFRLNAEPFQEQEMRCDALAASFIQGRELIEAIRIGESMGGPRSRRGAPAKASARAQPAIRGRIESLERIASIETLGTSGSDGRDATA